MTDILLVSPTAPNPRMKNRVDGLSEKYTMSFCYWDRTGGKLKPPETGLKKTYVMNGKSKGMKLRTLMGYTAFIFFALKSMFREKPTVIHAFRLESLISAYVYKILFNKKIKIVYEVADLPSCVYPMGRSRFKCFASGILAWMEKRMIRKTRLMVFTSQAFYDSYYRKVCGNIPWIIQEYIVRSEIVESYKRDSRFPETVTMAFLGNMRYLNMIETAAEAVSRVDRAMLKLGGFSQDRVRFQDILKRYPETEFLGVFDSAELGIMYRDVDVIYSAHDKRDVNARVLMANKFYESIMLGLPLIASRGTYMGDLVEEKATGYTVDENNPKEIAAVLSRLDESEMSRIAENCARERENYSAEKINGMLLSAYENIL